MALLPGFSGDGGARTICVVAAAAVQRQKVRCAFDLVIPGLKFFSLLEFVEIPAHTRFDEFLNLVTYK